MIYDKKTGDVQIIDKSRGKKKPILRNIDDLNREREALQQEVDRDADNTTPQEKAFKKAELLAAFTKKHNVDPS